ncbi:MAG: KOW domain-containing RNA-binding protein [Oscillospiraceae bacterium]|nr:KOW domain-containing RNA-binding protein [Oscillospiraceae bacterium]
MEISKGTVVISSAGHDKGQWFVVTGADGGYVFIADGKERKLLSPKKKNIKHIRVTSRVIPEGEMTDRKLRRALNAMCAESIAEESE